MGTKPTGSFGGPGAAFDPALYRLLVSSVRDYAILLLDADGYIRSWNAGAERLKGYRAEEIIGRHFSTFYTPEQVAEGRCERLLGIADQEGRVEDEGWRVRKDGTRFWADVIITALRDEKGQVQGYGKVTRDLSERRRMDEHLRQSEERYRLLVENVRDYAIFMLDARGYVRSWNAGAQALKGYTPDEIIGKHFRTFYPPEDVAAHKPERELAQALSEGRVEDEGWRVRKDGTRFWANVVITALFDDAGNLRGFGKVTRDLTERRRMEEAMRQSEERYRLLIEGVRDYAIFLLDPQGHVQSWNAGAEALKGYKPEEVIGKHFSLFYTPEDRAAGKAERELQLALTQGRVEDEGWRVRKDGTRFWANVVVTALYDHNGRLRGFGKVTRDLTERRRLEAERLAHVQREHELQRLLAMNAFKTQFINTAAHELNTPLTPILLQLDLLRNRGTLGPEDGRSVAIVHRNIERLQGLVSDLLDVARLEAGRLPLDLRPTQLAPLLEEVVESFSAPADRAKVHLNLQVKPLPLVRGDPRRLHQVLSNLVSNALKFTPSGGHILVRAQVEADAVVVRVEDTGIGISAADLGRLFTAFTQLQAPNAAPREGTGLGLFIAKGIVEAHGGRVGVTSAGVGQGSSFWFSLPLATDKESPAKGA